MLRQRPVVRLHAVAERLADEAAGQPAVGRQVERLGQRRDVALVAVAADRRAGVDRPLDPVADRGQDRRQRQVGVDVGARHPVLEPGRRRTARDHAAGDRAVVEAPRRPAAGEVLAGRPPVAVDRRRVPEHQLGRALQDAADAVPDRVADPVLVVAVVEDRRALRVAQRDVDVARGADPALGLRPCHERRRQAGPAAHRLDPELEQRVGVGHRQRVVVGQVHLPLAEPHSPWLISTGIPDASKRRPQRPEDVLQVLGLLDRVVGMAAGGRHRAAVVRVAGRLVAAAEEEELQLGAGARRQAGGGQGLDLAPEDRARRDRDQLAVVVDGVAEADRRPLGPAGDPQGRDVRPDDVVVPTGVDPGVVEVDLLERLLDVPGQRAGAEVDPGQDLVDERPRREPLADQPALDVDGRQDDQCRSRRTAGRRRSGGRRPARRCRRPVVRCSSDHPTAIDGQLHAGDVRGVGGEQERDRCRLVLGLPHALDQEPVGEAREDLGGSAKLVPVKSVLVAPGATALTWIPLAASSAASALVSISAPPFDAL